MCVFFTVGPAMEEIPPNLKAPVSQALIALPYYRTTNPAMAHNARHVIKAVLGEEGGRLRRPAAHAGPGAAPQCAGRPGPAGEVLKS